MVERTRYAEGAPDSRAGATLPAREEFVLHALGPTPIPSLSHIASTRSFVAGSISITLGQLRVNPSSGHFRVASIPIFDPYVNARLEWSRTSIGPIENRTSRSGSMWLSATHHASFSLRTFTSLSSTTITFASAISPWPHIAFITLYACPGYCLSIDTK